MTDNRGKNPRRTKKIVAAEHWYDDKLHQHEQAGAAVRNLLQSVLQSAGIEFLEIRARVKTRDSFLQKSAKAKYSDPASEIQDIVGVRVVTYFDSVARAACAIVESQFEIDSENSLDKSHALGTDRVGYRSVHYVARLPRHRRALLEYQYIKDVSFEIQIRSVLQHAWAEIEHDRRFKHVGPMPDHLSRRFSVLAGVLELADREFDSIAAELETHSGTPSTTSPKDPSSRNIELQDLRTYLSGMFGHHLATGRVEMGLGRSGGLDALEELRAFGVTRMSMLTALLPTDFEAKHPDSFRGQTTFLGILRDAMLRQDARRYFDHAFQNRWTGIDTHAARIAAAQGIGLEELESKYGIELVDDEEPEVEATPTE